MSATIGSMPNKPKTPVSTFRIPLDLKRRAAAKAKDDGADLTAVVVGALIRYAGSEAERKSTCGAPAVSGPCILPIGHNIGKLDIPSNHSAA